jgi:hypothetical protein
LINSVGVSPYTHLLELHQIACQSACLIREHVVYLAKLLI